MKHVWILLGGCTKSSKWYGTIVVPKNFSSKGSLNLLCAVRPPSKSDATTFEVATTKVISFLDHTKASNAMYMKVFLVPPRPSIKAPPLTLFTANVISLKAFSLHGLVALSSLDHCLIPRSCTLCGVCLSCLLWHLYLYSLILYIFTISSTDMYICISNSILVATHFLWW